MFTKIANSTILLNAQAGSRKLLSGRAWEVDPATVNQPDFVDLDQIAAGLSQLKKAVDSQFIDRAELTGAMIHALAAGEHVFTVSPPGAAKTKVIETLAAGIGGNFAERQITAETTTDEIFGPIDAVEFSNGIYTRRWAGIATSDIFYINEVWEASSTVTNIFKTALESRVVHDGDVTRPIPLLSAIADSNHVPTDKGQQADWDRFLVRLPVGYISDADLFGQMLTIEAGATPIQATVTTDQIRLLAAAAESLAFSPGPDIIEAMKELWRDLGQNGRSVSDRRWRKTLKLACAAAILQGEKPDPKHLAVGRWTLWNELDEREEVSNLVLSKCDPLIGQILDCEALLADLKATKDKIDRSDAYARTDLVSQGRRLQKEAELMINAGANGYADRLKAVANQAQTIWEEVLDW